MSEQDDVLRSIGMKGGPGPSGRCSSSLENPVEYKPVYAFNIHSCNCFIESKTNSHIIVLPIYHYTH